MEAYFINLDRRPDRLASFKMNRFPEDVKMMRFRGIERPKGEDGCTESHLQVLRDHFTFPFAVFEDDAVLIQPWKIVEQAMDQLPRNWDALWLGANIRRPMQYYSKNLMRFSHAYGLHAVIYNSQRIVDYILNKHYTKPGQNLDIFVAHEVQKNFNCFITYPMVATQLSDRSDISGVITRNGQELIDNYKKYLPR